MSSFEFIGMMACIYLARIPPFSNPWDPPPDRPRGPHIINLYYISLAGLVFTTAVTHPEQALSVQYGPFMVVPVEVLVGLYYNNVAVRGGAKAKM
jgi:hypothetical protein